MEDKKNSQDPRKEKPPFNTEESQPTKKSFEPFKNSPSGSSKEPEKKRHHVKIAPASSASPLASQPAPRGNPVAKLIKKFWKLALVGVGVLLIIFIVRSCFGGGKEDSIEEYLGQVSRAV